MDTVPALPNARRQNQFAEALAIERKVSALPAANVAEIIAKLMMMRGCLGTDDRIMLVSALQDLRALDNAAKELEQLNWNLSMLADDIDASKPRPKGAPELPAP